MLYVCVHESPKKGGAAASAACKASNLLDPVLPTRLGISTEVLRGGARASEKQNHCNVRQTFGDMIRIQTHGDLLYENQNAPRTPNNQLDEQHHRLVLFVRSADQVLCWLYQDSTRIISYISHELATVPHVLQNRAQLRYPTCL